MTDMERNEDMLDALFQSAAADNAEPSADLMARILADAEDLQPQEAVPRPDPQPLGWGGRILDVLGGWRPATGLATAALAGLWFGFSASTTLLPQNVTGLIADDAGYYLGYLDTSYGDEAEDG